MTKYPLVIKDSKCDEQHSNANFRFKFNYNHWIVSA